MFLVLITSVFAQSAPDATPEERPWSLSATASSSYTAGTSTDPTLGFGLQLGGVWKTGEHVAASAGWAVAREQVFCDTCDADSADSSDGSVSYDPGTGGNTSARPLEAGDLQLRVGHARLTGSERLGIDLSGALTGTLPASRDSLLCNPLMGALGSELALSRGFSQGEAVRLSAGVTRSFFAYSSVPTGLPGCQTALSDYEGTETLTGTVQPDEPWNEAVPGLGNADWSGISRATVMHPHKALARVFKGLDGTWFEDRVTSQISAGVAARHTGGDGAATVETLGGDVEVASAESPVVWAYPFSAAVGGAITEELGASLTVANAVPRLMYDSEAYFRALPERTSVTLALTGGY